MFNITWKYFGNHWLAIGLLGLVAWSQTKAEVNLPEQVPDAGSIMRNQPRPLIPSPSVQPPIAVPQPSPPAAGASGKITPKDWKITGATLIPESELKNSIQEYLGRELSVQDLWEATQKVAMYYSQKGYLVRAWLPEQEIRNGVVEIRVVEGKLDDVTVTDPAGAISAERARGTILAAQSRGEYLRMDDLERGVLLLNDMPGVSVTPTLKQGSKAGTTSLDLNIKSRPLINGSLDYANAGINTVGEHQFGGSLFINNAFGVGDQATFRLQGGSGNVYGRLTYTMPVGNSGLRVGIAGSGMYYVLSDVPYFTGVGITDVGISGVTGRKRLSDLDFDGDAWVGGAFASYPLVRGNKANVYSLAGFDTRRYHNVTNVETISDKTINVGYVGLQGDYRD
ncbi:MAG: ShlB/FhaC/HecB family hemolysin secretion/activation protein, partial [Candidatus Methylumidiphilus sp.]